ncbi:hypothetical protein [Methanosarcina sp. UBA289]|nr:hypothetical protein [Methanosarcina sp. UBA289]
MTFGNYKAALEYGRGLARSLVEEHMAAYKRDLTGFISILNRLI